MLFFYVCFVKGQMAYTNKPEFSLSLVSSRANIAAQFCSLLLIHELAKEVNNME